MRIVPLVADDMATVEACYEVSQAVTRADDPLGPPMSARVWKTYLLHSSDPVQGWLVPGDTPGSALGFYFLVLPTQENRHRAGLFLEVHPEHRRRGIGGALLRHAARQAAEDGRSEMGGSAFQGSAGEAFARRVGAAAGLLDTRRVVDLGKLPAGQVAALRESAAVAAAGYSLVSWTGRTPDEYLDGAAAVHNALGDAPRAPGHEARVWDANRVRERVDDQRDLFGSRGYSVAAVCDATGEMAAITQVEVDPVHPEWGHQQITAVARPHRGHRLGLLVKAAMLEWLAAAEPTTRRVVTWNAASNKHMVDINEALGLELLGPLSEHFEMQVADAMGPSA